MLILEGFLREAGVFSPRLPEPLLAESSASLKIKRKEMQLSEEFSLQSFCWYQGLGRRRLKQVCLFVLYKPSSGAEQQQQEPAGEERASSSLCVPRNCASPRKGHDGHSVTDGRRLFSLPHLPIPGSFLAMHLPVHQVELLISSSFLAS